jgi:hypothetical protein
VRSYIVFTLFISALLSGILSFAIAYDKILVAGDNVGAIDWDDLKIETGAISYLQANPPKDSEIIGTTWAKVNEDGSRDKCFKENYKVYRTKCGTIKLTTIQGFNTLLYTSNNVKAAEFEKILTTGRRRLGGR